MTDALILESFVGGDILNLITTGMYTNPLAIYREYIQNAADEFAASGQTQSARVEIEIDPSKLCTRIRDNGSGLSFDKAIRALLPIARSEKRRGIDRGFRGIGRLSGLAFAESVTFITRSRGDQPVTRIIWDGAKLRRCIAENPETERAIRECVTVETISGDERPGNFFEVEVSGVGRHAAGLILNRETVRAYVGEVCPVPIGSRFPFASEVEGLFGKGEPPLVLNVRLDGDPQPITRPFDATVKFSNGQEERFTDFEKIHIPAADGNGFAAVGWVAHSSYRGVIPKEARIRGIRARAGNIQVGDESIFDHLFAEERFNRWCVGELHIVDPRIIPNGRRDYFEPGPHVRNLENHLSATARRIGSSCREASAARNKKNRLNTAIHDAEAMYELTVSGYLTPDDSKALAGKTLERLQEIRSDTESVHGYGDKIGEKLDELEQSLGDFGAKRGLWPFRGATESEVTTYRKVFQALAEVTPSPRTAKELMEAILSRSLE